MMIELRRFRLEGSETVLSSEVAKIETDDMHPITAGGEMVHFCHSIFNKSFPLRWYPTQPVESDHWIYLEDSLNVQRCTFLILVVEMAQQECRRAYNSWQNHSFESPGERRSFCQSKRFSNWDRLRMSSWMRRRTRELESIPSRRHVQPILGCLLLLSLLNCHVTPTNAATQINLVGRPSSWNCARELEQTASLDTTTG